ncbi:MAG TPA: DUF4783 domain-containing protein [Bacteroidales bacterium]|nr:DUF4783 domain-containing protein [Bacteroidales bacterium]
MKKVIYILSLIILSGFQLGIAQTNPIPASISLAFKAGNADELEAYLNQTVELVLPGKEDFYEKSVAQNILREFFKEYQTIDFVIKHQSGKNDAYYAIGTLRTNKGTFRVYFLIKTVQSKPLIHQLRIEKDDTTDN